MYNFYYKLVKSKLSKILYCFNQYNLSNKPVLIVSELFHDLAVNFIFEKIVLKRSLEDLIREFAPVQRSSCGVIPHILHYRQERRDRFLFDVAGFIMKVRLMKKVVLKQL